MRAACCYVALLQRGCSVPQASLGGLSCLEGSLEGDSSREEGRNGLCHMQTCALNNNLVSNHRITLQSGVELSDPYVSFPTWDVLY